MVITCCVPDCKNNYDSGVGFHHFPKDKLNRKKWIAKTKCFDMTFKKEPSKKVYKKRKNSEKDSFDKVCKEHFRDNDFTSRQKKYLKKTAVPSINVPKTITLVTEHSYCFEDSMVKVIKNSDQLKEFLFL